MGFSRIRLGLQIGLIVAGVVLAVIGARRAATSIRVRRAPVRVSAAELTSLETPPPYVRVPDAFPLPCWTAREETEAGDFVAAYVPVVSPDAPVYEEVLQVADDVRAGRVAPEDAEATYRDVLEAFPPGDVRVLVRTEDPQGLRTLDPTGVEGVCLPAGEVLPPGVRAFYGEQLPALPVDRLVVVADGTRPPGPLAGFLVLVLGLVAVGATAASFFLVRPQA